MKHSRSTPLVADRRQPLPRWAAWCGLMFGLLMLSLLALPVHAQTDIDPPDRVGRLSELNGQVWIFDTQGNEWIAAARNRPVTTGDRVSTEADGRAEIRVGSTVLRIAPNTELEVLALDDQRVSVQLLSGSAAVRLKSRESAEQFSLSTAEGRFRAERTGGYRFDRIDDTSSATVLSGQLQYEEDGTALPVQAGQRVEFWKDNGVPQYATSQPARDDFSNWVASLESRESRSVSTRYVSAEMTGVEDLDRYGRWEAQTEYGPVWIPRAVAPGWAPYRMGHWTWVSPWGWTWVDDAPWGFAPFHYGRWVYYRNAWGWAPGTYVARPVYAPALVAWVARPGVSVSVNVGGRGPDVGWFPLGPREVYVPGYRASPRYVRNVNVTHVTNITNVTTIVNNPQRYMDDARYVNRGNPRAVTVVPAGVVERRQPVGPAVRQVSERTVRDLEQQRPRADAPVGAPPRVEAGARPVADPRTFRPREEAREGRGGRGEGRVGQPQPGFAPGQTGREVSSRPPVGAQQPGGPANVIGATPADTPRVGAPPRDDRRDVRAPNERGIDRGSERFNERNNDRDGDRGNGRSPGFDRGDARSPEPPRIGGRERPAPVAQPAPVMPATPAAPGGFRGNAPERAAERVQEPDRAMAPRQQDERRRHHDMPGPPPRAVQAPERAPAFQQPTPQVQAPQPRMQAPAPVMRQPEIRQPEMPRVQREAPPPRMQPEVRQQQPRIGAEDRGGPRVGEGGGGGRVGGGERRQQER